MFKEFIKPNMVQVPAREHGNPYDHPIALAYECNQRHGGYQRDPAWYHAKWRHLTPWTELEPDFKRPAEWYKP